MNFIGGFSLSLIVSIRLPEKLIDEIDGLIDREAYETRTQIVVDALKNYVELNCNPAGLKTSYFKGKKILTSFKLKKSLVRRIDQFRSIKKSRSDIIREALVHFIIINKEKLQPVEKTQDIEGKIKAEIF